MTRPELPSPAEGNSRRLRIPLHLRIVVLLLLASASGSAYLTRHCLAVANTTIQTELGLNSEKWATSSACSPSDT